MAQRDALWQDVEADIASGFLVLTPVASDETHNKTRQLSDRYTPTPGTRSLHLLHVAAALVLKAKAFSALTTASETRRRAKA